ncbi:ABC transporter permease [Actinomadura viridis]|uniref:Transport permease protein n=1 Tax=Actinomadura viridis TaxID=58110 RepID=A0A931GJF4_9ACTN|nr:ABC transporter permease [Actinomadura viridis]MBG6089658.1 ABC-type multidrug transport system permease subunit [Actinomadura viridis]
MTALLVPGPPRTPVERLRWAVADGWTVARRDLIHWLRNPAVIAYQLLWPIMMVLMFGYVFGSAMVVAGGGDYREFLMPGMFAQTMMFGVATTITVVSTDADRGVTDRFRSMPMSPSAVVLGRSMADLANSVLELGILVGCGLLAGWSWHQGPVRALAAVGLLLLLRFALTWVGILVGLSIKPEAAAAAWAPLFPLTMVANTFVSPEQMPGWLGAIATWNPLSATVAACRELFGNPGMGGDSWAAQHPILLAVAWPVALVLVFLPLSVRRYRRLDH